MLQGVWYIAADLNADPKMFLQSTVINMKRIQNSSNLELIYYAQKESDGRCIGPGNGTVKLTDKGELHVHIEYTYSFVPGYKSSIKCKFFLRFSTRIYLKLLILLKIFKTLFQSNSKSCIWTINEPFSTGAFVVLRMGLVSNMTSLL